MGEENFGEKGGVRVDQANIASEKITLENKERYKFILDDVRTSILKKWYGELAEELMLINQINYDSEFQAVFEEMIQKYPDDLFIKFIKDEDAVINEFEEKLKSSVTEVNTNSTESLRFGNTFQRDLIRHFYAMSKDEELDAKRATEWIKKYSPILKRKFSVMIAHTDPDLSSHEPVTYERLLEFVAAELEKNEDEKAVPSQSEERLAA